MVDRCVNQSEQFSDLSPTLKVGAMGAPGGNHLIRPCASGANRSIIIRAHRIGGGAHFFRIRIAPGKDIGDAKCPEAQGARTLFTALNRGIILHFGRCGWV